MSITITGQDAKQRFHDITLSYDIWADVLSFAEEHGWEPAGTLAPQLPDYMRALSEWKGSYLTSDGQTIAADDAAGIARAIARIGGEFADRYNAARRREHGEGYPDFKRVLKAIARLCELGSPLRLS